MKHYPFPFAQLATLGTLALLALPAVAQDRGPARYDAPVATSHARFETHGNVNLELAPAEAAAERGARKLAGQAVRGIRGESLGNVKDFIIDSRSGKIEYVVVSSGGVLGAGDQLHAVPIAALKRGADKTFLISMDRDQWNRTPTLIEEAFGKGIVTISDEQRGELDRAFAGNSSDSRDVRVTNDNVRATDSDRREVGVSRNVATNDRAANRSASPDALLNTPWIRASELRGRAINADLTAVGKIEEIIIDLDGATATALVDPVDELIAGEHRVIVPMSRLELVPRARGAINARVTRADFALLQPRVTTTIYPAAATTVTVPAVPRSVTITTDEQPLTPTGSTGISRTDRMATSDTDVTAAVRAVRSALDAQPSLAGADVQVTPENGKVILRGRVATETQREAVEKAAKDATRGVNIDNFILVGGNR